jgi:hypothetical protein
MSLNERFKQQLADAKDKPLTESDIKMLKGSGMYGPYSVGDTVLFFLDEIEGENFSVRTCTERELDRMEKEFEFVRMAGTGTLPVFKSTRIHEEPDTRRKIIGQMCLFMSTKRT